MRAETQKALDALAARYGLLSRYTDGRGEEHVADPQALQHLLAAMGVPANSLREIRQSTREAEVHAWLRVLDEVATIELGAPDPSVLVSIPLGGVPLRNVQLSWSVVDEAGERRTQTCSGKVCRVVARTRINRRAYVRVRLPLDGELTPGYYRLKVNVDAEGTRITGNSLLIVHPRTCYLPSPHSRKTGITVQLYNLRSRTNWGIGDFRDLAALLKWAGSALGVAVVGVSPLHEPAHGVISPYSPSSRLFISPLYLHLEDIPEFRESPRMKCAVRRQRFREVLGRLRNSPLVPYDRIRALKQRMLGWLYDEFLRRHLRRRTPRALAFERYCHEAGDPLARFAAFSVLSARFGTCEWRTWPAAFRKPTAKGVVDLLANTHDTRLRYVQWVQWQCHRQLTRLDRLARREALTFRLYHDLPVGVHPHGADAWMFQDELASGMTLGAPPDHFNVAGQNWGLMAPIPRNMRKTRYRFFIETVRQNMRYGGMLRIDHALGLFRLFVVPEGKQGEAGLYVKTAVDELLAVLALESTRHRVMVVGEDLGAVTDEIRQRLGRAGLLSYRLMPFEQTRTGRFRAPSRYPREAAVSFTTHDLPTLKGYWEGRDIQLKASLGLYQNDDHARSETQGRQKERVSLLKALAGERLVAPSSPARVPRRVPPRVVTAAYQFLARTPSRVLLLPLEDLVGEFEAPNLPSAPQDAYPSWSIRLTQSVEQICCDARIRRFVRTVTKHRA